MHTRTVMAIVVILVLFVTLIQPRLLPRPVPQELAVTTRAEVTIVPITDTGVASIQPAATSTEVTHDLGRRPAQVLLTPNGPIDVASGTWWVSTLTAQAFTVNIETASASSTAAFFWQAIPPPQ